MKLSDANKSINFIYRTNTAPHDLSASQSEAARSECVVPKAAPALGSSSFITDATGYATQHLQYLPFGETFVDQQNGYDARYKFSAKEKDDETQYSYFGARYLDTDLSIWLSVDPMSDAFPNMGPYAYCGNNPLNNIDRDGAFFEELKNWAIGRGWVTNGAHRFMKQANGAGGASSATARKATNNVTEVSYNYTNEETGKDEMKTALFASKGRNAIKHKDAYVIESKHTVKNGGYRAVTFAGQYIKVSHGMLGNDDLINHEYGHWLQWEAFGRSALKYYWKIGIPSISNVMFGGVTHDYHHAEVDANRRATADGYSFSDATNFPTDYSNTNSSGQVLAIIFEGITYRASDGYLGGKAWTVRRRNIRKFTNLQRY